MNHEDYTGEMLPARYAPYRNVIREIDRICEEKDGQILIAIDGQSASGKTTLGELLKEWYDCNLFHMDDFFLAYGTAHRRKDAGNRRQCGL